MKIQVLDDRVANQIAAGEVVERPVSVIRELVDNAIDAGASRIELYLENGGRSQIKVVDNGSGMNRQDALMAFERHATSKIRSIRDLNSIETYGFRGEALAAIAAVSRVSLVTRSEDEGQATQVNIKGGKLLDVNYVSGSLGSCFTISNLFFNTPARRKFLAQEKTEERRALQWIRGMSLARPELGFKVFFNDQEVLLLPASASSIERAKDLFKGNLLEFNLEEEQIKVKGLIGHPSMAASASSGLYVIVNNRVVQDSRVLKAAKEAFGMSLKAREFPVGFIEIEVAPQTLDINVHPQKSEVRFSNPQLIYDAVFRAVSGSIQDFKTPVFANTSHSLSKVDRFSYDSYPTQSSELSSIDRVSESTAVNRTVFQPGVESLERRPIFNSSVVDSVTSFSTIQKEAHQDFKFSRLRYVGKVLKCYLVCELENSLYLVDMHAAHERINFNKIKRRLLAREVKSQELLIPVTLNLAEDSFEKVSESRKFIECLGFSIDLVDDVRGVVVRSVPDLIGFKDVDSLFRDLLNVEFETESSARYNEYVERVAARLACHASVRSGDEIGREEVYALFKDLDSEEFSSACPHGRPVIVEFNQSKVEGWFGRDK